MGESFPYIDTNDMSEEELANTDLMKWEKWANEHEVEAWGICDQWALHPND